LARLTVRRVISAEPKEIWDRLQGGSICGQWVASTSRNEAAFHPNEAGRPWREGLRLGPLSFEVSACWAERHPPERGLCFLDGPWGLRVVEEIRLERIAAGTEFSLTLDYCIGNGWVGEWLDRMFVSRWIFSRLNEGSSRFAEGYRSPEEESSSIDMSGSVHLERPDDRPWGLDQKAAPRPDHVDPGRHSGQRK
jgi:hypothetical protein